jgi:hypothetical protein
MNKVEKNSEKLMKRVKEKGMKNGWKCWKEEMGNEWKRWKRKKCLMRIKNRHGWNPIQIIFTINELMISTIIVKGFKITCCGLD